MKNLRFLALSGFFIILAVLGGCASTPQPALDQANNGAALTMALQAEVQKFRAEQLAILQARLDGVRRLQLKLADYEINSGFDAKILELAGKKDLLTQHKALVDLSDSRIKDEQVLRGYLEIKPLKEKTLGHMPSNVENGLTG